MKGRYVGANPLSLSFLAYTESADWFDATTYVQGLEKLSLTWSTTQTPQGPAEEGEFRPKKGVSGTLTFENAAYDLLKEILVTDVASPLNHADGLPQ